MNKERRGREPALVGVVGEDRAAAADGVDDLLRDLRSQGRATPAATKAAEHPDRLLAEVGRAVHDDGAIEGHVVDAFFQAAKTERVAVAAFVRIGCNEKAEAGGQTAGAVGEEVGDVAAAPFPMRDELAEEKLVRGQVKAEEPRLG